MGNPLDIFKPIDTGISEGMSAAQAGVNKAASDAAGKAMIVDSTNQQQTLYKQQQAQAQAARGRRSTILTGLMSTAPAPGTAATNTPTVSGDPTKGTSTLLGQ